MVKIHFWQEKDKGTIHMKVQGHAGTAPKGADLVCASATMEATIPMSIGITRLSLNVR